LLLSVYPEYEWLEWKFYRAPVGFWHNNKNKRKFLDWAGKQLGINEFSDWYNIPAKDIRELRGTPLDTEGYLEFLSSAYPEYKWEAHKFKSVTADNWNKILQSNTTALFVSNF
jgi:hypothetical protein